jgi:hypothetical protein
MIAPESEAGSQTIGKAFGKLLGALLNFKI